MTVRLATVLGDGRRRVRATGRTRSRREAGADAVAVSVVALGLVTSISPLATDTYLAALPAMQVSLDTSQAMVQATLTTFVAGFAAGQLITGPISDGRGRRPFVLAGVAGFLASTVMCAAAPSVWVLLAARAAQGFTGGMAVVAGRAMVTDRFTGTAASKQLATLFSMLLLGPILAPVVGSALLTIADWRSIFIVMAAVSLLAVIGAVRGLPETLPAPARTHRPLHVEVRRFAGVLHNRTIASLLAANAAGSAAVFVYVGSSAFVYERRLGASPTTYGVSFALCGAVMAAASFGFRRLVGRHRIAGLHLSGAALSASAASVLLAAGLLTDLPIWAVVGLMALALAGNGFSAPANMIRVQTAGQPSAATASAVSAAVAYLAGAVATPLAGLLGQPSTVTLAALMAALFGIQLALVCRISTTAADACRVPTGNHTHHTRDGA